MRRTILALVAVLALAGAELGQAALPVVGKAAPDFAVKSATGRNVRLSELRGQVVLINFWASWCGPCRLELPVLAKLDSQYRAAGFTLLAINLDDNRRNAEALLKKLGVQLVPMYDRGKGVARLYDVDTMPATVIVDRDGRVRYLHRGFLAEYEAKYQQQVRELLKQ